MSDARLEVVARAGAAAHRGVGTLRADPEQFLAMYDAAHAFDVPTAKQFATLQRQVIEFQQHIIRREVVQHSRPSASQNDDNATAPLAGADPPWLEEGYGVFREAMVGPTKGARIYAGLRAFAAFAARQPRPITDAMVIAANAEISGWHEGTASWPIARAALEAAERAR